MELSSTKLKLPDSCGSGDVAPQESDLTERLIEQEAARLSSLAIQSALQYLQEERSRDSPDQNHERSSNLIQASSSNEALQNISNPIQMTAMATKPLHDESTVDERGGTGEEAGSEHEYDHYTEVEDGRRQSCSELIDIEEFLISEAENLFYSEMCVPESTIVAGTGEGRHITPSQGAIAAESSSCDGPKRLINLDWAKAKEFKPRKHVIIQMTEPNSAGPSDTENNSASASSDKDGKYYNNNNCHDRIASVKLIGQDDSQTGESHLVYHDALDLSVEDNSQSDVLDIIVLPDSNNVQTVDHPSSNSGGFTSGAIYTNSSNRCTKPTTFIPPPPALPPRQSRGPIQLSASRVPINMILPVRPPCRPPFNMPPHPYLPSFRQPSLFLPHPPHPIISHPGCSPHLAPPTRYPTVDCGPYFLPPLGCFYPPDSSPPPGIQYGYSQRGKRRKAQRLSSRFPTQAGKIHHHANFYVKSCAESVVARRAKLDNQPNNYQTPVSRSQ